MKYCHEIISDHIFRGKTSGKSNDIARVIYGAKFFNNTLSLRKLIRIASNDIDPKGIDFIVPVNTRDSKYNIPSRICYAVSKILKIGYADALYSNNSKASDIIKGRNVLLFDDVIYTGATMNKSVEACKRAGARSVKFFAICHSKSFKND